MRRLAIACAFLIVVGCSRTVDPAAAYSQAWSKFQEGRLSEADKIASESLGLKLDVASAPQLDSEDRERLYLLYCEILLAKGRAPDALARLNQFTPKAHGLRARWLLDRAEGLNKTDHRGQATTLLNEVDRIVAEHPGSVDGYFQFKALMVRTSVLSRDGMFAESELMLRNGLQLANAHGNPFEQAAALLNLSFNKLGPGSFDESLQFSKQSLDAAQKANAGQIAALAENNIGMSYRLLGDLDQAEEFETKAIEQLRRIDDLRNLQDALGELGSIHLERHQAARAVKVLEEAFEIAKRIESPVAAGRWAGEIATVLIEQGESDKAEEWNRRAYALFGEVSRTDFLLDLRMNDAAILAARGQVKEAMNLYRAATEQTRPDIKRSAHIALARLLKNQDSAEANAEYEKGLAVIDERGRRFGPTYLDLRIQSFKEYADLLISQHDEDRALQVVESSRARTLREKLNLPPLKIDQIDLKKVQEYARKNRSVLVSYSLAPQRSFVWVVRPDSIRMHELPGQEQLEPAIRIYRKMIEESRDPIAESISQGEHLSDMLLKPILSDVAGAEQIIVVPDGALHALNLEALPVPGTNRYWIEDAQISIAPSLSILEFTSPAKRSKPSLLLVGAPHAPDPAFPDLPAAQTEVREIQKHFPGSKVEVQTGQFATPTGFLDANPEAFSMIHFAAHAEANAKTPLDSAVILSQDDSRYKLYASEIASRSPKLTADLVTLSACRSAGARAYGGEGLVGFAWAFLQSGARSVVAGLWDVSDTSSSLLMNDLYREISKGMPPAAALRQAKLNMLRSSAANHKPVVWAPFQIFIR